MQPIRVPNKCDYCGLKQVYPPDAGALFTDLHNLFKQGIIKQSFPRKLFEGDGHNRDEFCLIANQAWLNINAPCDDWALSPLNLSKSDYLSLNASKKAIKSAESTEHVTVELADMTNKITRMTRWMLLTTIFSAIAAVLSTGVAFYECLLK